MSSPTSNRRKSKAAWSKEDDIRLCRAFVMATQDGEGTEHVKNMWTRVHTHYAALVAEEEPEAAPRAGGALQTHWSSFIRPESAFFMNILDKVEKEEHEGWTDEQNIEEAKMRFEAIRQAEEEEAMRAYREAKQQAILEDAEPPSKPRIKPLTYRYTHCIPVLRTSTRFMRAALSERKPRAVRSPAQKRHRRPKDPSDDENVSSDDSGKASHGHEAAPKRRKASDASSAGSVSGSGSSVSSSPSDDSSDEGVPMPKSAMAARAVAPLSQPAQASVPRVEAQNGRHSAKTQVLRAQRTQQKSNYRLKLLAELRGIVETIAQLANQLANGSATPTGLMPAGRVDPTLAEEVQQDLRFFRDQKRRLKLELDALDAAESQS